MKFKFFLLGFLFHLSAYIFRSIILYLYLKKYKINFAHLLSVHFIHNLYSHVVPASLGELSFPILLKKRISISKSISVLIVLRILTSMITIFLFVFSLIVLFSYRDILKINLSKTNVFLYIIIIIVLFISIFRQHIFNKLKKVKIFRNLISKFINVTKIIRDEIVKLKEPKFLIENISFALLSNMSIILFYFIIFHNLGIDLNFYQIIFVSSIGLAFLILPIKSIGGFGTTEGSLALGLVLVGINKQLAIQTGFVVHIIALMNVFLLFSIGILMRFLFSEKNVQALN